MSPLFHPGLLYYLQENVREELRSRHAAQELITDVTLMEKLSAVIHELQKEHAMQVVYAATKNEQNRDEGIYSIASMKAYTQNYIKAGGTGFFSEYYKAKYDSVLLDKSLRQNIVFSQRNLTIDKSFNEFQMIICLNVLIYFNQNLQDKVLNLFYESLCPLGFLGLGNKESLLFTSRRKDFEEIVKKEKIYMKMT